MSEILRQMKETILAQKTIMIISHSNPDGDTLGSQLALANAVNQFGIGCILINSDHVSEKYAFLKQYDRIRPLEEKEILPEVVVFVDCATAERTGYSLEDSRFLGKTIINIDHHTSNAGYGALNYVKSKAAASVQVVYELLVEMGIELTREIATALYLGLSTDTGSFLFDNVSADTHRLAAVLIEANADTDAIRMNIYENISVAKFQLQRYIYEHAVLESDGTLAWSEINQMLLQETKADSADIDGLINSIKDISGVEIAVLFRELTDEKVKISFRSKSWADVNVLAAQFGGGGHVRAAGCTLEGSLEKAKADVLRAAKVYLAGGQDE